MSEEHLFVSSAQMSKAVNYNRWTYSQFAHHIRGSVLEVGCGVGNFTKMLLAHPKLTSLHSIDISPEAVAACTAKISDRRVVFDCADVCAISGSYDFILCMNVLEHIEDHEAALGRMLEMLAPGGRLFLLVPAHQALYTPFDEAAGHYRRYNKPLLRSVFDCSAPADCTLERCYYFNAVGALGYYAVYGLLRKEPTADTPQEISLFDSLVVPVMRNIEGRWLPFGLSLIGVMAKEA